MAKRFKKKGRLGRTYLAQWREFRHMSQDDLAAALDEHSQDGISGASISRIESGIHPYSQDFLEAAAIVLQCTPGDIISRDPFRASGEIDQAIELLNRAKKT
jgi:transcriptional regulator with XRE-family HTH domain